MFHHTVRWPRRLPPPGSAAAVPPGPLPGPRPCPAGPRRCSRPYWRSMARTAARGPPLQPLQPRWPLSFSLFLLWERMHCTSRGWGPQPRPSPASSGHQPPGLAGASRALASSAAPPPYFCLSGGGCATFTSLAFSRCWSAAPPRRATPARHPTPGVDREATYLAAGAMPSRPGPGLMVCRCSRWFPAGPRHAGADRPDATPSVWMTWPGVARRRSQPPAVAVAPLTPGPGLNGLQ